MSQQSKPTSFLVLLVVLAVALLLVSSLLTPNSTQSLQYSDVLDLFRNEKVTSFTLEGSNLTMQVRGERRRRLHCHGKNRRYRAVPRGPRRSDRRAVRSRDAQRSYNSSARERPVVPRGSAVYHRRYCAAYRLFLPLEPRKRRAQRHGKLHEGQRPLRHSGLPDRHVPGRCRRRRGKGGAGADRGLPARRPQEL